MPFLPSSTSSTTYIDPQEGPGPMNLSSLHVQECGWALPCIDFVQVLTAAVASRVKQPHHAQNAAFFTTPQPPPALSVLLLLPQQRFPSLWGPDGDVSFTTDSQNLTSCEAPTCRGFVGCFSSSLSTTVILKSPSASPPHYGLWRLIHPLA